MNHHMALDLCSQRQDELARMQARHALRGPSATVPRGQLCPGSPIPSRFRRFGTPLERKYSNF